MTPAADPGSLAVTFASAVAADRLEDGESVILAVRPSGWLIVQMSWPLLVGVAVVAAVSFAASHYMAYDIDRKMALLICMGVGAMRLAIAISQWQGRLYILTDRRVIRIKGVFHEDCYQCRLKNIRRARLSTTLQDRMVSVATLVFERLDNRSVLDADWICLANPEEVLEAVEEALNRAA